MPPSWKATNTNADILLFCSRHSVIKGSPPADSCLCYFKAYKSSFHSDGSFAATPRRRPPLAAESRNTKPETEPPDAGMKTDRHFPRDKDNRSCQSAAAQTHTRASCWRDPFIGWLNVTKWPLTRAFYHCSGDDDRFQGLITSPFGRIPPLDRGCRQSVPRFQNKCSKCLNVNNNNNNKKNSLGHNAAQPSNQAAICVSKNIKTALETNNAFSSFHQQAFVSLCFLS